MNHNITNITNIDLRQKLNYTLFWITAEPLIVNSSFPSQGYG